MDNRFLKMQDELTQEVKKLDSFLKQILGEVKQITDKVETLENIPGYIHKTLEDPLPGSPDPPEQLKPSETTTICKAQPAASLPPGLEYLHQLDQIIIHQQVELLQVILGTETCSKYEIKNHMGQRVYFAVEENGCFDRNFCSPLRSFTIRITDNTGQEVITVNRPLRCNSCWFPCYLQELEVQSPPGTTVGYVIQKWDPLLPKFTIRNENNEDVLKIIGPYATCGCFGDVDFEVKSLNEMATIGKISKYWSGFVNNIFTNTANFGIQVPVDLDVKIKAVMIGACFLIDLMFFENSLDGL
ncbi:PREDICTED: phospholipid scramblase family member 5-like [Gekko japonicus]|uniref:Phospholipid scramblase n=1 Tax=Gekko japonicus TaxID=146911 RepID=A0ABM1KDD1_GEKJA|nr:PREDICTED: phospholipid scramblase family member 5-like [Gekko japonicus]